MLPIVDKELDRLEKIGAISSVDYSQCAAPIVVVRKKNGKPRVCADFSTGLNDAIELNRHPIPQPEDLFNALKDSKFFSTLDLSDAYLQIELDDESKKLCGITTHRGLYRFNRLPFGVKSAPAIFQSVMDQMLAGIPLASVYLDDIIVGGKTLEVHTQALFQVFERIAAYGFHINLEKCHFPLRKIHYLGRIVDAERIRPDPERTQAFRELPTPEDLHAVRSFLGALNYYGRFLPQIRAVRAPLDRLTQKDVKYEWTAECQHAFEAAKDPVCYDLLLCHYDPNLPIEVAADASNLGIGATISHRFPNGSIKVIEHASRVLTAAERDYGQIEKEGLALIFAVKKFHRMIYGRRFTLLTDHKPLLSIFGSRKGIPAYTASRHLRWALKLLAYDFEVKYVKTTDFGQAGVLSRLIAKQQAKADDEETVIASFVASERENEELLLDVLATNIDSFPITSDKITDETATDDLLQQVIAFTKNGWPRKCPENRLSAYFNKRDSLSLVHAHRRYPSGKNDVSTHPILMSGSRVVVPTSLRSKVLKKLHFCHPGIVRMKALARQHVYWPGIDSEIEQLVRSCSQCARTASQPVKHELTPWPETNKCWSRIHIDYAGPTECKMLLVVVDFHSKWLDVGIVPKADTSATIAVLRRLFALHGLCRTIVSDNGTQFTSFQFKQFCKEHGTEHPTSPPGHPQSNGQAERFVATTKQALLKLKGEGQFEDRLLRLPNGLQVHSFRD
ncbi:Integrase [Aphelenchoides avenae]|nr:Integrase [Aphelenchus avenae]